MECNFYKAQVLFLLCTECKTKLMYFCGKCFGKKGINNVFFTIFLSNTLLGAGFFFASNIVLQIASLKISNATFYGF